MTAYTPVDADLRWLACPLCRGSLTLEKTAPVVRCVACNHQFPIVDGLMDLRPAHGL